MMDEVSVVSADSRLVMRPVAEVSDVDRVLAVELTVLTEVLSEL